MKKTVHNDKIGDITYEESFWTGNKSLAINGVPLAKISKNEFETQDGRRIKVNGGIVGASVNIDGETIQVTPKLKWYEVALCVLPFVLIMVWGNVPALCRIVPVVGGAIGGAISGFTSVLGLFLMRKTEPLWLKIAITLGVAAATFGVCCGVAYALLAALA